MVEVSTYRKSLFDIQLNGLTVHQVTFLMAVFQNSPMGYANPNDEPESELELRKAIYEACNTVLSQK